MKTIDMQTRPGSACRYDCTFL